MSLVAQTAGDATALQVLELDLQGNNLSRVGSRAFEGVKTLLSLDLAWSNISRVSTKAFRSLRLLRHLSLAENRLRRLHSFIFRDLRSLETLSLAGNKLTRIEPDLFRYQSNLQVPVRCGVHSVCNNLLLEHLVSVALTVTNDAMHNAPHCTVLLRGNLTSVSETIRKAQPAEAQTTLGIQKYVLSKAGMCPITEILRKTASLHNISLKSDNRLLSYGQKRFLKWRPYAILNFRNFHIWSRDCHRLPNLHILCTEYIQIG